MTFQKIVSKHLFILEFKRKENCQSPLWVIGERNVTIFRKEDVKNMKQGFEQNVVQSLQEDFEQH